MSRQAVKQLDLTLQASDVAVCLMICLSTKTNSMLFRHGTARKLNFKRLVWD